MLFAMRFSALSSNATYNSLTANQILSASISLRDLICNSDSVSISCNSFSTGYLPAATWTQSNMTWSLVSVDSRFTQCSSKSVFYGNGTDGTNWYDFDATAIVKAWKNGTKTDKVAVFKTTSAVENGTVGTYLTFASSDRASNNPSLTITYLPDIMTESTKTVGIGYSGIISHNSAPAGYHIAAVSSNTSIVSVSSGLTITAISAGTAVITAYYIDDNNSALYTIDYCNVTVTSSGITINNGNSARLTPTGSQIQLSCTTTPLGLPVTWSIVSGGAYATISGSTVTMVKPGITAIRVEITSTGIYDTIYIHNTIANDVYYIKKAHCKMKLQ